MRAILAILNFLSQTLSHQVGLNRSALTAFSFATLLLTFSTIALMLSSLAIADEPSGENLGIPNAVLEESGTGNSSNTELSLEELIQTGWARSRYRNQTTFNTNSGDIPAPKLEEFEKDIKPRLVAACIDCHGESTQEGNPRIDTLNPNLHTGNDVDWWNEVFAVLSKGEMPPPEAGEMAADDRRVVVDWLSNELHAASIVRRGTTPRSAFRRMTRYEFNYALQDLLGLPWNFARDLPPEPISADGFQNNAELLQLSVSQFQTFQRLAYSALNRATVRGEKPTPIRWAITMRDNAKVDWPKINQQIDKATEAHKDDPVRLKTELEKLEQSFQQTHPRTYYHEIATNRNVLASWSYPGAKHAIAPSSTPVIAPADVTHVAIIPPAQWLNVELGNQLPDEGLMRVRVRASRTNGASPRVPTLQLQFGWQASNEGRALLRVSEQEWEITATADAPEFYEWNIPLGEIYPRNSVRKTSPMGAIPSPSEYIRLVNSSTSTSAIHVDYVEVLAPVYDQWPPDSHKRVFIDSQNTKDEAIYACEVISTFLHRAWRRPIADAELNQKIALFQSVLPHCDTFEDAIVEVLAASLASPNFLFIVKAADSEAARSSQAPSHLSAARVPLSSHELASRLSVFLWCSIPDRELLELAETNALLNPNILEQQVERMLADPRAYRFTELFVTQWLDLDRLNYINLNHEGRRFDPALKDSMLNEPIALFNEILRHNESVLGFLHADFAMLNERLAKHYGIDNVYGNDFRRVSLDGEPRRGGLLTAAGPLTMNSDYPDSHPLKRGKWLLESLLNDPPPPPPPAVPEIDLADPEIAKMTLKERIEDHRNHPACISCHIKIDPWGIAFENYDALGLWRDSVQGKPVDAQSELINHEVLNGIEGLKRYLLTERQDQFVRAFVTKLSTIALGRSLTFADQADLETITANARKRGDGLATIVKEIVQNELFLSK